MILISELHFYSDVDIYNTIASTTSSNTGIYINSSTLPLAKGPICSQKATSSGNTWTNKYRFIFEPGTWPTTAKAFSLIFPNTNSFGGIVATERSKVGILTALQTPYNPYSQRTDMIVGLDYTLNWIRG